MRERVDRDGGVTTMLPTEDAQWVAAELTRRFGLTQWSFTLSATDANRWLLRLVRLVTQRPKILVFSYSYHGTVDETFVVVNSAGDAASRPGNVAPAVDPTSTTRVVEFNDVAALERALAHGDVAAVLTEPALMNIGIVLPEPGFLEGVRALCDAAGTLLILDEAHTFSAGPGGATQRFNLSPDALTIGKSLGGGVPCGAYRLSDRLVSHDLPWSIRQLGARCECRFAHPAPRNGGESALSADPLLEDYLHLYGVNRGVLLTPFHNMALMCPATTQAHVERHQEIFDEAVTALVAPRAPGAGVVQ